MKHNFILFRLLWYIERFLRNDDDKKKIGIIRFRESYFSALGNLTFKLC